MPWGVAPTTRRNGRLTALEAIVRTAAVTAVPMARDQLRKFLVHVWENPEVQDQLESRDAAPVAIAAAAGFVISEQEYAEARAGWKAWQLSSQYDEAI